MNEDEYREEIQSLTDEYNYYTNSLMIITTFGIAVCLACVAFVVFYKG